MARLRAVARSVALWVGKTDDEDAPPRVRARVFLRCQGKCHRCERVIRATDKWTLEHLLAIILGGRNAEDNLVLTCEWCLPEKNAEDQAAKSKVARIRNRHLGIRTSSKPLPGGRNSPWKIKMNGQVVRR